MESHRIIKKEGVKVYKGDVFIGDIPIVFDLSSIPPVYHLRVASAIAKLPQNLLCIDGAFETGEDGHVRMVDGNPVIKEKPPETPGDSPIPDIPGIDI